MDNIVDVNILEFIEQEALAYENGKMMRSDSEVEIDVEDDGVWLCDYSAEREGAELVKKLCEADCVVGNKSVKYQELIELCDRHHWSYVI